MKALASTLVISASLWPMMLSPGEAAQTAGEPAFSSDPAVAAQQRAIYDVVERYEGFLNSGNTKGILALFAPESVAEWNNKPTFATQEQRRKGYDALFKIAKFNTVFGYASIDAYGDTGVIRTYHHKGARVSENGKTALDLNREVFVLRKFADGWKIVLYTFNTDPNQGEG